VKRMSNTAWVRVSIRVTALFLNINAEAINNADIIKNSKSIIPNLLTMSAHSCGA
jgi:hypothetical protein